MEQEIEATISGKLVKGKITYRSQSGISVEITSPYKNMQTGMHIPYFAREYASFQGKYGDDIAIKMLNEIFVIARNLSKNIEHYRKIFNSYKKDMIDPNNITHEEMSKFIEKIMNIVTSKDQQEAIISIIEGKKDLW